MKVLVDFVRRTIKTAWWWMVIGVVVAMVVEVTSLNGPNVCMVKQKYNITKRVKYRAPMAVRTYEWCFAVPPRCSRWTTEMRDLTKLETEERTAEMAVCCPGYKLKDVSCVPICPHGKTGRGCSEDCPPNKWGPNCAHECKKCLHGTCSATTGECLCQEGWQGESCETSISTTAAAMMEQLITTAKATTTKTTLPTTTPQNTLVESTTSPMTTDTTTTKVTTQTTLATTKKETTLITTNQKPNIQTVTESPIYNNTTLSNRSTTHIPFTAEKNKNIIVDNSQSNMIFKSIEATTEKGTETYQTDVSDMPTESSTNTKTTEKVQTKSKPKPITALTTVTQPTTLTTISMKETTAIKLESTRRLETTIRHQTTAKFKPKEIWIRPAQKGESPLVDLKIKPSYELPHTKHRISTKKEITSEITTPKTIIVSIIPTSMSYATFKKIALTTASYISHRNNGTSKFYNTSSDHGQTRPMTVQTTAATPFTIETLNAVMRKSNVSSTVNLKQQNVTKTGTYTSFTTARNTQSTFTSKTTNSMFSTSNANRSVNYSNLLTTISPSTNIRTRWQTITETSTKPTTISINKTTLVAANITEHPSVSKHYVTVVQRNITIKQVTDTPNVTKILVRKQVDSPKRNLTNSHSKTNPVTDDPAKDEETFHILTEPEHITAVMGEKGTDRSSADLISVLSIAGGLMMAVITVAVVIVMLERCKRPRYEDVRKYNDIRMQVMMDNNDVPPPYVRSIFHTPLPEPPTSEKCHYQPISTLDRNLKQFMRPVVVQTISPLMLENFRGILECHYDHLPRRSHDMGTMQTRCSTAPSIDECQELLHQQRVHSLTESTIEAMKCEAKLDVIDHTTSEPLYAEIPCWRPPSEHAIEIVNLNGEAVTEL